MCTQSTLDWGERNLTEGEVRGKRVVEVGSYDVNGSLRSIVERLGSAEYVGTDMRSGPGVDVICPAERLVERFGKDGFDLVISTCVLEHVRDWSRAISNIKNVCKPDGLILVVVPSKDWPFHAYPGDYWRYELEDVENILDDCERVVLEEDSRPPSLVYAKFRKPNAFIENDLTDYKLYSIIGGRRVKSINDRDFFTFRFVCLLFEYLYVRARSKIAKPIIYIVMGVKLRIVKPFADLVHFGRQAWFWGKRDR
jgi:SAM-dependent methyltransferase